MMIDIQNSEHYYSLPGLYSHVMKQHLPEDMCYRSMMYLMDTFMTEDVRHVIYKLWGIDVSRQQISHGLHVLRQLGYVTRGKPGKGNYIYRKTSLYKTRLMDQLE